ncbi:MFS transporter [Streptomyces longispororuber]|uniref:MFS transporter n=1 Tax=Streptomyces longispororuber TaxID=68230 RepID=UPI0033D6547C
MTNPPVPPAPGGTTEPRALLTRLGIPRPLSWGYLGLLVFMTGVGIEAGFLSPYLEDLGVPEARVAMVFTVYGVTGAVAAWLSGALSDLWGPRRVMWLGLVSFVVTHVFFLAVAVPSGTYPLLLVGYGLRGLAYPLFAYAFLVWIAAVAPPKQMGSAMGWFWSAFSAGLPTLGSLTASLLIPVLGERGTLWAALGVVTAGGLLPLLLVRERTGAARLAAAGERPLAGLVGSLTILVRTPRVGAGAVVRMLNTASQFGFLVMLPAWFTDEVGLSDAQWLRLLALMFATNIVTNLLFGVVGDKAGWRGTVAWCGGVGCTVSTLLLYYVPAGAGDRYALCVLVAVLYGATLSGYVPLSALMTAIAPAHKGRAMAALNLGAGASAFVGPLVVSLFRGPLGVAGVVWIFAGLHAVSALLTLVLKAAAPDSDPEPGAGGAPVPATAPAAAPAPAPALKGL